MRIYLAGSEGAIRTIAGIEDLDLLVAYPAMKRMKIEPRSHWFIDSGAYSVYTGKVKHIDLDAFIKDLKIWRCQIFAGLDVIGDAERSRENCERMRQKGLVPIPTYHIWEDPEFLSYYCENYDYIALGGIAHLQSASVSTTWLDYCFKIIGQYWPIRVHGFAITGKKKLERYPFYSVDSTNWLAAAKFGNSIVHKGIINFYRNRTKTWVERTADEISAVLKMQDYITNLWDARGINWQD